VTTRAWCCSDRGRASGDETTRSRFQASEAAARVGRRPSKCGSVAVATQVVAHFDGSARGNLLEAYEGTWATSWC
jgi:hypothetical protein